MSHQETIRVRQIINDIKSLRANIHVPHEFSSQVEKIDHLLHNDKTGIVDTILDFMVHSATVPMKIETENENLNTMLEIWQDEILNRGINIDIPSGFRELSAQYYRERWRSSFIGLKVRFEEVDFGENKKFIFPTKMWLVNGGAIDVDCKNPSLPGKKYFLKTGKGRPVELRNKPREMIFIRKPYALWHQCFPVPYLVKRGILFNALLKEAIVTKQADVIETIIPYLLTLKAGTDLLAERNLLPTEKELKKLQKSIKDAVDEKSHHRIGELIASLSYDTELEHFMPDLIKVFDPDILKSVDRNLLAGLGLVELEGFSKTRQESVLNPKVLVEEVTDAVLDWACLIETVILETIILNRPKHPKFTSGKIQVIPGTIKAFMTNEMRTLLRGLYDRGLLAKETTVEEISDLNFEVQVERRTKEDERNLQNIMKAPIIQNLEQFDEPTNEDRQPGTPEADNFNQAVVYFHSQRKLKKKTKEYSEEDIIQTPDELPENIKSLSLFEQLGYFINYNLAIENGHTKDEAHEMAVDFISSDNFKIDCRKHLRTPRKRKKKCDPKKDKDCPGYPGEKGIFDPIDDLPDNVKNVLPVPAQMIWLNVFNSILKETNDEVRAIAGAWSKVGEKFKKVPGKKLWVRK